MSYNIFSKFLYCTIAITSMSLIACNKDDDHYYVEKIHNKMVYISLQDMQGKIVDDSITIAKLTGFKEKITDLRGATQERPFDYEDILYINNTWYYTIVPSSRYNVKFPDRGIYIATDTISLANTKYELQQKVDFNLQKEEYAKVVWTKIDGQTVTSLLPNLEGTYIKLSYR